MFPRDCWIYCCLGPFPSAFWRHYHMGELSIMFEMFWRDCWISCCLLFNHKNPVWNLFAEQCFSQNSQNSGLSIESESEIKSKSESKMLRVQILKSLSFPFNLNYAQLCQLQLVCFSLSEWLLTDWQTESVLVSWANICFKIFLKEVWK